MRQLEVTPSDTPTAQSGGDAEPAMLRLAVTGLACSLAGARDLQAFWAHVAGGMPALGPSGLRLPDGVLFPPGAVRDLPAARARLVESTACAAWADAQAGAKHRRSVLSTAAEPLGAGGAADPPPRALVCYSGFSGALPRLACLPEGMPGFRAVDSRLLDASVALREAWRALAEDRCDVVLLVAASFLDGAIGAPPAVSVDQQDVIDDRAEGVAAVVLQRATEAADQGARVYAQVLGARSGDVAALLAETGAQAAEIGLVESPGFAVKHDRGELAGLQAALHTDGCPTVGFGAARTVVGDLGSAALCAGLVKLALACHHRLRPPMYPDADLHQRLSQGPLLARWSASPWLAAAAGGARRALLHGGTGPQPVHALLQEPPPDQETGWQSLLPWRSELVLFSAASRAQLQALLSRLHAVLHELPTPQLGEIAMLQASRFDPAQPVRLAIVAVNLFDLAGKLARADHRLRHDSHVQWHEADGICFGAAARRGKLAFLFPGVGFPGLSGGYAERLGELALHFPEVRHWLDHAQQLARDDGHPYPLAFHLYPPPYSPPELLETLDAELKWSQRASMGTLVANLATFQLMRSFGLSPDALGGFSLGEWCALLAAGLLDPQGSVNAPAAAGDDLLERPAKPVPFDGSWAMVNGSVEDIAPLIAPFSDGVEITIDVSRDQVFIGGRRDDVAQALDAIQKAGFWGFAIPNNAHTGSFTAYHTRFATEHAEQVRASLEAMPLRRLDEDVYSSVTGRLFPREPEQVVELIVRNATAPVQMRRMLARMHQDGMRTFVQLGGGGKLLSSVEKNLALDPHLALSIDLDFMPALDQLQHVLARLAALGVMFTPAALYRHRARDAAAMERLSSQLGLGDGLAPEVQVGARSQSAVPAALVEQAAPAPTALAPATPRASESRGGETLCTLLDRLLRIDLALEQRHNEALRALLARLASGVGPAAESLDVSPAPDTAEPQANTQQQTAALAQWVSRLIPSQRELHSAAATPVGSGNATTGDPLAFGRWAGGLGLAGAVLSCEPGVRARSRLLLSTREHRFLAEYALLAVPDGLKYVSERLPTLPFAFALEVMAEAAQTLVPGLPVLACEDAVAVSFVSLKQAELALIVDAERSGEEQVTVTLRIEGGDTPVCRGRVRLGRSPVPLPEPFAPAPGEPAEPDAAARYYARGPFFQGALYRAIARIDQFSDGAVSGWVTCRQGDDAVRTHAASLPLFDGFLLDAAAQLLGYPMWRRHERLFVPCQVRRVVRHRPMPVAGEKLHADIRWRHVGEREIEGDMQLRDADGHLVVSVEGWRERWMLWPKAMLQTNHRPYGGLLCTPLDLGDDSACAMALHVPDLLEAECDWVARLYLRPAEWLRYCERPRRDWLLGRIAAKDAVRSWLQREHGRALHALEIEIGNAASGQPQVIVDGQTLSLPLSITHLDDRAVAVVCAAHAVGIDAVEVVERDPALLLAAFDRKEAALLPARDQLSWLHRFWTAKEAAAKVRGVGYEGLYRFRVVKVHEATGCIDLFSLFDQAVTRVYTRVEERVAMAYAKGSRRAAAQHERTA